MFPGDDGSLEMQDHSRRVIFVRRRESRDMRIENQRYDFGTVFETWCVNNFLY